MPIKFPIVLDRVEFCSKESRLTTHRCVIYPDTEYHTCNECGTKRTIRFDREAAEVLYPADKFELENIEMDLQILSNKIRTRDWGKLGKKDTNFIEQIASQVNAIGRRVRRLKDSDERR